MQFSDTTNKNGLIQRCEKITNLGYGAISDDQDRLKEFTVNINTAYHELHMIALQSQDGFDVDDHNYEDLMTVIADLHTARNYTFNDNDYVLNVKRVDVSYDGERVRKAEPIDIGEIEEGVGDIEEDDIDTFFEKEYPHYDLQGDGINLYPKADTEDISNGGKLYVHVSREAVEFDKDDTTEEPFLPRVFHEQIAQRAAYRWLIVNKPENESLLSNLEADIGRGATMVENYYGKRERDRNYQLGSNVDFDDYM